MVSSKRVKPTGIVLWWATVLLLGGLYCLLITSPLPSSDTFTFQDLRIPRLIATASATSKVLFVAGLALSLTSCVAWYLLSRRRPSRGLWARLISFPVFAIGSYIPLLAFVYLVSFSALESTGYIRSGVGWRLSLSDMDIKPILGSVTLVRAKSQKPEYYMYVRILPDRPYIHAGPVDGPYSTEGITGPAWSEALMALAFPPAIRKARLIGVLPSFVAATLFVAVAYLIRYPRTVHKDDEDKSPAVRSASYQSPREGSSNN